MSKTSQQPENIDIKTSDDIRSLPSIHARLFELLLRRHYLTEQIADFGKCYPPTILERAQTYEALEYDDLAAFDGYVVYTLCQKELSDEFVTDLEAHSLDGECWHPQPKDVRQLMIQSLALLVRCLTRLGAIEDARVKRDELREQIALTVDDSEADQHAKDEDSYFSWRSVLRGPERNMENLKDKLEKSPPSKFGRSRREIYPWSTREPARNTPESVSELNKYLSNIAPNLEAKVTALPDFDDKGDATEEVSYQLGLFAKADLLPGQEVLNEKSILTAIRPLEDALCDACAQELEGLPFEQIRQCDGEDCDVTFCSQDCKDRAVSGYHRPNIESTEDGDDSDEEEEEVTNGVNSLTTEDEEEIAHDSKQEDSPAPFCGNQDISLIGRPTNTDTAEWDLYFLLLTRSISMSMTQSMHPLNLSETKFLWGDFDLSPFTSLLFDPENSSLPSSHLRTLPFSLKHSIQHPLDFFATLSLNYPSATPYTRSWLENLDPWILQTLFAKFRGVANATQSTFDGQPEIAAVHAGWSLANHSCAPNVRWNPIGVRRYHVRSGDEVLRVGDDGTGEGGWNGIKAGEEVFSHYTDVRRDVVERRLRLREVLGGKCRCKRCLVESGDRV